MMKVKMLSSKITRNYDEDIKFLTYLVGFKCTIYTNLILKSQIELSRSKLLNDDDLNNAIDEIVISINDALSEDYKTLLMKYFKDEKELQSYITEFVLEVMTTKIGNENNSKIKKINTSRILTKNYTNNSGSVKKSNDIQ
jgi:hypothetical protein